MPTKKTTKPISKTVTAAKAKAKPKNALVNSLKKQEAAIEKKGGPKTAKEKQLEKTISNLTGKPFKGKR